jgi:hypothetical protein
LFGREGLRKKGGLASLDLCPPSLAQPKKLPMNVESKPKGPINGCAEDKSRDRIQIVGCGVEVESRGFKRDAAPACCRVQNTGVINAKPTSLISEPFQIAFAG